MKIENCPFCLLKGIESECYVTSHEEISQDNFFVACKTCGYFSPISQISEEQAISAHNTVSRAVRESIQFEKNAPRVMKLLRKDKPFVVVANDEPYYIDVFYMIRYNEMIKSRWTEEDEKYYQYSVTHLPTPYKEGE